MELRHKFDLDLLLNQTNLARSSYYYHEKRIQQTDKYQPVKELNKYIIITKADLDTAVLH
jgi:putative transposase